MGGEEGEAGVSICMYPYGGGGVSICTYPYGGGGVSICMYCSNLNYKKVIELTIKKGCEQLVLLN